MDTTLLPNILPCDIELNNCTHISCVFLSNNWRVTCFVANQDDILL